MNSRIYNLQITIFLIQLFLQWSGVTTEHSFPISNGFLAYRTISTSWRKYCTCPTKYSCSCCQSVIILYTKAEKRLCVNVTHQNNGLTFNVMLNTNRIKTRNITDYKPFKFCITIPGCLFSYACVNVSELNQFSSRSIQCSTPTKLFETFTIRSITVCLRLDVFSKKQQWQINYDCISISTEMIVVSGNSTIQITNGTEEFLGTPTSLIIKTTAAIPNNPMTSPTTITTSKTETDAAGTIRDVEVITEPGSRSTTLKDID
ncbi:uncharacterized protein LOC128873719 isoform X2 [Hylaeus volcanicus]|uniref:uncharacterized protein LOC128873719 isoform X2 n=1 Tax=Hylaeus volcanicus TaxID=313075 RepID=UPI0023B87276|nr:uncharacterized protein LOC128873719 isoform X2 [Hylaeus volcanicus]